jgi:hypothetical protein
MQYAASFASIGVIVILIAYTVQGTVQQVSKAAPFTNSPIVNHANRLFNNSVVAPAVFHVDKASSKLIWTARKVTGQHTGRINISKGVLNIDNNILTAGSFELDTRSISVTDIKDAEGNSKLTGRLTAKAPVKIDRTKYDIRYRSKRFF